MTSPSRTRGPAAALVLVTLAASIVLAAPGGAEDAPGADGGVRAPDAPGDVASTADPVDAVPVDPAPGETVRVIVELETPVVPEAELSDPAADQQREAIDDDAEEVADALDGTDAEVVNTFETLPAVVVEADAEALDRLAESPDVASVTVDGEAESLLDLSTDQVRADEAWAGGDITDQQVAILDTGVEGTHPHLAGRVVHEACFAQDSDPSNDPAEGDCPNNLPIQVDAGAAAPCQNGNCDHGTHVAGIAASQDPTPNGHPGVAKGVEVVAVRVFHDNAGGSATAFFSDITAGLDHLYAKVNDDTLLELAAANLSLGASTYSGICDGVSPTMTTAIQNLKDVGVATVAASGNNGRTDELSFPGCIGNAISVGSVTTSQSGTPDLVAGSSNASVHLDLLAPGVAIDAATGTSGTSQKSGTSMAAPHVAGAFAVLRANDKAPPSGLDEDVVDHLHGLLADRGGPSDCVTDGGNGYTYRRIDVQHAVELTEATGPCPIHQPDNRIRRGTKPWAGNNIYNTNGDDQTRTGRIRKGGKNTFSITVENDGNVDDSFKIRGGKHTAKWSIAYFAGTQNISQAVKAGTYSTDLAAGTTETITAVLKPKLAAKKGNQRIFDVTSTSMGRPLGKDTARIVGKRR